MADDARIDGYANALFEVARVEGSIGEVEDELFRFARTLEGNDELRSTLTDAAVPAERRLGVVQDLLGAKASPVTTALVSFVVSIGRAGDLVAIIAALVQKAATAKDRAVATVRSAVPLTNDQQTRLAARIVAEVGDTVIDGTVRSRLEQLRAAIQ